MSIDPERRPRPEDRIAGALVGLLGATQQLAALTGSRETLSLLAREELDTGEIALARNQLTRVLQRIDAEIDGASELVVSAAQNRGKNPASGTKMKGVSAQLARISLLGFGS